MKSMQKRRLSFFFFSCDSEETCDRKKEFQMMDPVYCKDTHAHPPYKTEILVMGLVEKKTTLCAEE